MKDFKHTRGDLIAVMFLFSFAGLVVGGLIFSDAYLDEMQELGEAICNEEYDSVFVSYKDGVLECEKGVKTDEYDGIKIVR